jgi:hypothetical protein
MTSFSTAYPSSVYETDPTRLPRFLFAYDRPYVGNAPLNQASGSETSFTALGSIGTFVSTVTSTALVNILNVTSGRGTFRGAIGPSSSYIAANTHTWTITVDGTAYSIVIAMPPSVNYRTVVGDILEKIDNYKGPDPTASTIDIRNAGTASGIKTPADVQARTNTTYTQNLVASLDGGTNSDYPVTIMPYLGGRRFIKFNTSLKVDITCSAAPSNQANCGAYAAVIYNLDT